MPLSTDSLIPDRAQAILSPPPAPTPPVQMRAFGDTLATRRAIYDNVLNAATSLQPLQDPVTGHALRLSNVRYVDPERFTRKDRKRAILTGETLGRRMKGTWELVGPDGEVIDRREQVVARVPYLSSLGTFVNKGSDYTLNNQQRLNAGAFARVKDNGEYETHANFVPGKGISHRYFLDPKKSLFKVRFGQSELPLMPLLKAMGATDKELQEAWRDPKLGDKLWEANAREDDPSVLQKLRQRVLNYADRQDPDEASARKKLVKAFESMELDPEIARRTLGTPHARMNKDAMIALTRKLLQVSKGEADPDDRDHLANQTFFGPEDLFAERIARDHGGRRKLAFREAVRLGNLSKMPSGVFTPALEQALLGSGLGQALEEINPAEVYDRLTRITRMGEGGIPSLDAIPDEARGVQPSHMGYMDPVRTPESFRVGVDVHMARGARKGSDGRIYAPYIDRKTGQTVYKSPQDVAESTIATPEVMKWDTKTIPVMRAGKVDYVPKEEVDYVVPQFEDVFSPLANLIPGKSTLKAQRMAMGSRYVTQALPLVRPEAPLVRGALPEDPTRTKSFEEEFGKHMGAVRAERPGVVEDVRDGVIRIRHDDGTRDEVELYETYPFNRKTFVHQTAAVEPGQRVAPGQLLARSNYTDDQGVTALGKNLRTAYIPWRGYNYKDAIVISETAARELSSEHMYQNALEVSPRHKVGLRDYVSLFPGRFDKATLSKLDSRGIIRVGQTVEHGEPLILAAREKDRALNKVHKKRQPGYADEAVLWDHHDPGVVTDVVWGKDGPVVLVKSQSATKVGDKLAGRYGDKGVVAAVLPDGQMPHGADGQPYHVLLSPLGIISRTNPVQKLETWLSAVARKTGKPVTIPDFQDIDDLTEWTERLMAQAGVKDTEPVTDPVSGRKLTPIAVGERFLMKLHHTAESKGQGRGSGGYTQDDAPAKGGAHGCFVGDTPVTCWGEDGKYERPIGEIVEGKLTPTVSSFSRLWDMRCQGRVTDHFRYRVDPSELVELELDNGTVMRVTRNHEFFLRHGPKVLAGDLKPGDNLLE